MFDIKFSRRPRAYFAAPLFNEMERRFNVETEIMLAPYIDIFLPQRDGGLLTKLVAEGMSLSLAKKYVFKKDVDAISNSDIVIAVLDGRTVDEGVAFELGCAYALGKLCIGLKTDVRALLATGDNPMITECCHTIVSSVDELIDIVSLPPQVFST
ncbi:nucleoside 2-deoxyribosyltransferase [Pseudomonas coleopterorum]|uniref:nucleoside 2-deoxyribosyltransferase n=1 Tax=Pseudomonas coleopterorum TaxID=1605838 RepID=UPI002A6A01DC|nr:nucleoside 2-deoxyribosyltransferase [Pseudomonas coleopterorum]MDY1017729.1 nucleoside 2-deoxyribosyltransferase [Pseudomonas coleopterorum]